MTDLEFGRAWAAQQAIAPTRSSGLPPVWEWAYLPRLGFLSPSLSEAEAYAVLGEAVRAVHAAVPQLTPTHK